MKQSSKRDVALTFGPGALVPIPFIPVDQLTGLIAGGMAAGIWLVQGIEYLRKRLDKRQIRKEWLMGHDMGIPEHHQADRIKQEYSKFEQALKLS